ncbi:MAG: carbonic anhydrase [Nitrosomonadales bacterium]|nr:carbonic anhydrase [Nitrosomonadales bacterium]
MKRLLLLLSIAGLALAKPAYALDAHGQEAAVDQSTVIVAFLNGLRADNSVYMGTHKIEFFAALSKGQTPKATVVTCSDSRVQANMFDRSPEGELFTVRNIGNQMATAEGSVEYGVHHLHTPVLLFLGHSRCGAIAAVSGNYSKESDAIKRELDTITIAKDLNNIDGVRTNVHSQVTGAMLKFAEEIAAGQLTVIGAVMDFADDLHQGAGKLHLINVNGETDPAKLDNLNTLLAKQKPKAAEAAAKKATTPAKPAAAPAHH